MLMIVTDAGKVRLLFSALCATDTLLFESWWIELFQSNTTVTDASALGDFTLADFPGYSHVEQTRAQFNSAAIVDHVASTTNLQSVTFGCTGGSGQTIYGWLLVGQDTGELYAGQNFDTPRVMRDGAEQLLNPFDFLLSSLCLCAG